MVPFHGKITSSEADMLILRGVEECNWEELTHDLDPGDRGPFTHTPVLGMYCSTHHSHIGSYSRDIGLGDEGVDSICMVYVTKPSWSLYINLRFRRASVVISSHNKPPVSVPLLIKPATYQYEGLPLHFALALCVQGTVYKPTRALNCVEAWEKDLCWR